MTKSPLGPFDPSRVDYNQIIDEPPSCELCVRPIIPVRFSLSDNQLRQTKDTGSTEPDPSKVIDNDPHYDLRRIRQGYVYMYSHLPGHCQKNICTDDRRQWLVFRYITDIGDENSPKTGFTGSKYCFTKYQWENGTPQGEWILDNRSYRYMFVSPEVSIVDIAYSEHRWPASFFAYLEKNYKERFKIMQTINFIQKSSSYSFPASELEKKVADFNKNAEKPDNALRRTNLGYSSDHKIKLTEPEKKEGRVVALHDPVGNAQDLGAAQQYYFDKDIKKQEEHLYAITTAFMVRSVSTPVKNNKGKVIQKARVSRDPDDYDFWKGSPVHKERWKDIDFYTGEDPWGNRNIMQNFARAQKAYINQTGDGSLPEQRDFTEKLLSKQEKDTSAYHELREYLSGLVVGALREMDSSYPGLQELKDLIPDSGDGKKSGWGKTIDVIFSTANSPASTNQISDTLDSTSKYLAEILSGEKYYLLIETVSTAQLARWAELAEKGGRIQMEKYLLPLGLKTKKITVNADKVGEFTKEYLEKLMNRPAKEWAVASGEYMTAKYEVKNIELDVVVASGQDELLDLKKSDLERCKRIGAFIAAGVMLYNMTNWKSRLGDSYEDIVTSSYVQFISDGCSVFAALAYKTDPERLLKDKGGRLVKDALKAMDDTQQAARKAVPGIARFGDLATKIGRAGNFLGIIIATGQYIQARQTGDQGSMISAALMGASELCFFLSTLRAVSVIPFLTSAFVWVGVALLIAGIIVLLCAYDDLEKWLARGFWGPSDVDYWGDKRPEFTKQLERSKDLTYKDASDYSFLQQKFTEEINEFFNLTWQISIRSGKKGDRTFLLSFPGWKKKEDLDKVIIKWKMIHETGRSIFAARLSFDLEYELIWRGPGKAVLKIPETETLPKIINSIRSLDWAELIISFPNNRVRDETGRFETVYPITDWSVI